MSYEIHLKETAPWYLNLELTKDGKVETFCDTNISKDFLYQFGAEYVQMVCENTVRMIEKTTHYNIQPNVIIYMETLWNDKQVKANHLYNLFSLSFLDCTFQNYHNVCDKNQELLLKINQDFRSFIAHFLNSQTIEDKNVFLERSAWVFFNSCQFRNREGFLNAGSKLLSLQEDYKNLGEKIVLDGLYFKYIEAIDKWKTQETKELQHIKQFQSEKQMSDFYTRIFDIKFREFLERKNIDTLIVIPNNQVRQINFNAVIEEELKKDFWERYRFGEVHLNAYEWREAQKSTQWLSHRIENAKKLFIIKPTNLQDAENILLIDDVFGSGATINTVAQNIKKINPKANIIGFTLIGSYRKGFDVVNEV